MSAIKLAKNPMFHASTKHLEIHHHFIHKRVPEGELSVQHIKSHDQTADIFRKVLPRHKFEKNRAQLGMTFVHFSPHYLQQWIHCNESSRDAQGALTYCYKPVRPTALMNQTQLGFLTSLEWFKTVSSESTDQWLYFLPSCVHRPQDYDAGHSPKMRGRLHWAIEQSLCDLLNKSIFWLFNTGCDILLSPPVVSLIESDTPGDGTAGSMTSA